MFPINPRLTIPASLGQGAAANQSGTSHSSSDSVGLVVNTPQNYPVDNLIPDDKTRWYSVSNLETYLSRDPAANKRLESVKKMQHDVQDDYTIISSDERTGCSTSIFRNKYEPSVWTFIDNHNNSNGKYYASDVTRFQYEMISRCAENPFFGKLPTTIIREGIVNEETMEIVKQVQSNNGELLQPFMTQTPNGRSTQRILDLFGLRAVAIEDIGTEGSTSFAITTVSTHEHNPSRKRRQDDSLMRNRLL